MTHPQAADTLVSLLASAPECEGLDGTVFVAQLRRCLAKADSTIALHRAMASADRPEKPISGFIVKRHGDEGMERVTFTRLHWGQLTSAVASAVAGVVSGPWLAGAILVASSAYTVLGLPQAVQGLQAQVLYEVCLSCNDSQAHEILVDTLYVNLEDSRDREGVTWPALSRQAFDAAVDALLNAGILAPGQSLHSVRLGELVLHGSSGWL